MEQALGPRGLSTPDVIKSALDQNNEAVPKVNTSPFDNLFGVPDKITIPERYVPEPVSIMYTLLDQNAYNIIAEAIKNSSKISSNNQKSPQN